jgi:hypothetical protein
MPGQRLNLSCMQNARSFGIGVASFSLAIFLSVTFGRSGEAAERYYIVATEQIEGAIGDDGEVWSSATQPLIVDGGEAYLASGQRIRAILKNLDSATRRLLTSGGVVAIRTERELPLTARVRLRGQAPSADFLIDEKMAHEVKANVFLTCQRETYAKLLRTGVTGGAWFRHEVRRIDKLIGFDDNNAQLRDRRFFGRRGSAVTDSFALVSGGRALSENMQLGRQLPEPRGGPAASTVSVSSIAGITVKEFPWDDYVAGINPELDPLSHAIPHDQHAIFFTSFAAMVRFADEAAEQGTPILRLAEPQGIDAMVRERYETQLGLSLDGLAELIGPQLIETVALTGGDPYFRTGTDVAVMFTSKRMLALRTLLQLQTRLSAQKDPTAKPTEGKLAGGTLYTGMKSDDNRIRSYVAVVGETAVVSNSLFQLGRIEAVIQGKAKALASLDEYHYFRNRYPLSQGEESGLLIITDATIRRWCSPKWRIATSRRTRAAAALLDVQAQFLGQLATGKMQDREIVNHYQFAGSTKFVASSSGLRSEDYGDMRFQIPIDEMEMPKVTPEEQQLYNRWRDGYQRNWSNYFDPIAIRFVTQKSTVGLDMTVMPLIDFSQYRGMVSISKGASLKDGSGDPHPESLIHWTMAVNTESAMVKQGVDMARSFAAVSLSPLSWLGDDLSIYVDDDPIWAEAAKLDDRKQFEQFLVSHLDGLPVAVQFDVRSGMRLTLFLTAVRGFVDQLAPGMLAWTPQKYKDHAYVTIGITPAGRGSSLDEMDNLRVYYVASGDSFTVTLSETVVKRAIDRIMVRAKGEELPGGPKALGENVAFHVNGATLPVISRVYSRGYQQAMQRVAFSNIPILNEWKKRFPDREPVEFHAEFWQQRLMCPGGGVYQWNEEFQTMESTVYGHPGMPKVGPGLPPALSQFSEGDFGLTFEKDGLRARVELQRKVAE